MKHWIHALRKLGGDWEICRLRQERQTLKLVNGQAATAERSDRRAYALRLVRGTGQSFVVSRDEKPAAEFLRQAVEIAENAMPRPLKFSAPALAPVGGPDPAIPELQELSEPARRACLQLQRRPGIRADAHLRRARETLQVANSAGHEACRHHTSFSFSLVADLTEPGSLLTLPRGRQLDRDGIDWPGQLADRLADEIEQARTVAGFCGGSRIVLFSPRALADILVALEAGLNGQSVALGRSPLCGRLGERVLDPRVSLREEPGLPGGNRGGICDDEGMPCRPRFLFEGGVLRDYLHCLQSASLAGTSSTGNGHRLQAVFQQRDIASRPAVARSHWSMAGGDATHEELLASLDDGLYADILTGSFMGDVSTGNFQANLWLGWAVRGGRRSGRVKNAIVSGNIYRILGEQLLALSRERSDPRENEGLELPFVLCRDVTVAC